MRTKQEIFDAVVLHLRTQKDVSVMSGGVCAYRGNHGLKCAIGILIPDEVYLSKMEGLGIAYLIASDLLSPDLKEEFTHHQSLLSSLQGVHDAGALFYWEKDFKEIATKFGLQYTAPTQENT